MYSFVPFLAVICDLDMVVELSGIFPPTQI